ncbi:MAG: LLM class flavin-dependent oxidoreductase [Actinomycetota bacterium]
MSSQNEPATARLPRRAVCFTPMEADRATYIAAAEAAECLGYEALVVPEGWTLDAGSLLAELATRTDHIQLVSGIQSVWSRTPASLAMQALTLDEISGGRFVLGLGVSTPALAEGFHGAEFRRPAALLRSTATTVRALLRGERSTRPDGSPGLRLGRRPQHDVPLWIAGLGPRSVAVANDVADAWFPAFVPRERLAEHAGRLTERHDTAESTGDVSRCEFVCGPMVFVGADELAREQARQLVGWYLTGMGALYADAVAAAGFGAAIAALRAHNPHPKPGRINWAGAADPLLEQFAVIGRPDQVAADLIDWDLRVDMLVVTVGPGDIDTVLAALEAAAPGAAQRSLC